MLVRTRVNTWGEARVKSGCVFVCGRFAVLRFGVGKFVYVGVFLFLFFQAQTASLFLVVQRHAEQPPPQLSAAP